MLEVSLEQKPFYIGGFNVGQSVVTAWCVLAVLIAGLAVLHLLVVRKMKEKPAGVQNVLELVVDGIYRWSAGKVGEASEFVAPVVATSMTYVFFTTVIELFGIAPATEDINCTLAMGLCTFLLVNVTGLKFRGIKGRIHGLATPSPVVLPIRVLTDFIAPCSIAIRLFANVMVGGIIMQLIYAAAPLILPSIVASYFNVLHVGIQTFVLGLLTLIYVSEVME
ncbi:MAG: FoF1 ATP synthase subunit a [Candidatus Limiplasma sp.]|nr:FoF1 ATP synthase subunit a [Candidatus Limiplasma sp.]